MVPAIGARAVGEGSPMKRSAVGIRVRSCWDKGTDRACESLYRGPVDPGSLRSLPLIAAHTGPPIILMCAGILVETIMLRTKMRAAGVLS